MYNYSVITPYRDKAELLYKAISSIPDREDIEVIIVDNSEQEGEAPLPCFSHATVKYLHSDSTKGAGHARNVGLSQAQGRFLLFLDSDDYFTDSAFENFDKYLNSENDITFFYPTSIYLEDGTESKRHITYKKFLDNYKSTKSEDEIRYRYSVPWSKLYRAEFIKSNNITFDETKVSNDLMFSLKSGHYAKQVAVDDNIVYVVTEGKRDSSLTRKRTAENQFIRYKVAVNHYLFVESVGRKDLRYELLSYIVHAFTDYGFTEFCKYMKYALDKKVNIFYGFKFSKIFK